MQPCAILMRLLHDACARRIRARWNLIHFGRESDDERNLEFQGAAVNAAAVRRGACIYVYVPRARARADEIFDNALARAPFLCEY